MKKIICIIALLLPTLLRAQNNKKQSTAPEKSKQINKETMVEIITDFGTMRFKLYNETPLHRDNFIKLAKEGYFNGTLFHRVMNGFMIQGGDPNSKTAAADAPLGNGGPGYTIPAEFNPLFFHKKGALAAARLGDQMNPEKASSGSQFYIVQGKQVTEAEINMTEMRKPFKYTPEQKALYSSLGGTPFLDGDYTVFGEIISGMDVIDKIAAVATNPANRPLENVKMTVKLVD
jgi:peptidyl-prolyl cis-trans isomerase B (cyclophilin B)